MDNYKRGSKKGKEKPVERKRRNKQPEVVNRLNKINSTTELLPSGVTILDLAMGGGFPWGKNTNIVGDRSAGKTILTSKIIVKGKQKYGEKLQHEYDDAENGYSFPIEVTEGFHIRDQDDYKSDTIEELKDNSAKRIKELEDDERLIYVCDTVEGLNSEEELNLEKVNAKLRSEGKETKGSFKGQKAAHMNELLRRKDLREPNVMPIFVSQVRKAIGVTFGSVKTRHCQDALEFYCSIILYLRVAKSIIKTVDKKEYEIGSIIEIAVKKNKVIGSKFKPLIIMRDGIGMDNTDTNVCFLFDLIDGYYKQKEQIKVEFDDKEFKSRIKLIEYIETNDLEPELERLVTEKWKYIMGKLAPVNRKHSYV